MEKEQNTTETKKKKIDFVMASAMVLMALCFDLLSTIPIVSILTSFTFWMITTTWFYLMGINPFEGRRLGVMGVSAIAEIIPIISIFPGLTVGLIVSIIMINNETLAKIL